MNIPFGHQQLHNRYCFEGELELTTALRISSGRPSDETDAPFIRTFDKTPYIPGSSLRGAIRSEIERILASVGEVAGLKSCTLFAKDSCADTVRNFLLDLEKKEKKNDAKAKNEQIAKFAKDTLCDVCKLFGSTVYASRLVFEDALPAVDVGRIKIPNRIRDGVGIDRDTGSAKKGAKFDYEVIEPIKTGLTFLFKMTAENVDINGNDKKLINLILYLLKHGLYVGGKRAGGLGKIKLKEYKVTGFENSKSLWASVVGGREIHNSIEWEEAISC